jgi:ATP-dependent Clp protease ATP-binding subunit ClpC
MFNFNIKKAAIFQAVVWKDFPLFRFANILKNIFFVLFLFFLFFAFSFAVIFFVLSVFFFLLEAFFNVKLKNPKIKNSLEAIISNLAEFHLHTKQGLGAEGAEKDEVSPRYGVGVNLAEFLDLEAADAIWQAINFSKKRQISEVPSEAILYFLLKNNDKKINFVFGRSLLDLKSIQNKLEAYLDGLKKEKFSGEFSSDSNLIILEAAKFAQQRNRERIGSGDLLIAEAKIDPVLKRALIDANLKKEDIENLVMWFESLEKKSEKKRKFWEYENLMSWGSFGRDLAAGYTLTLDQFSMDWLAGIRIYGMEEMVGHEKEVLQMERILSRDEVRNVLLIGEPGAGRMKIVQELAKRAFFNLSSAQINSKRIINLDVVSILAQGQSQNRVEEIMDKVFKEAIAAGNVILVIDDFHNFVGQQSQPGVVDISGLISRYLSYPKFQMIAVTNFPGFHRFIEPSSISILFEKIEVLELTEKETILALTNRAPSFERKYKLFISYPAIRDIVKFSSRYLPQLPFPKKAIDLLDEISVYVSRYTKSQIILPEHVARIISDKTQIPIGEIAIKEKGVLLNLEKLLHERIINQEEGVREISTALRRARAEITVRKGPMGCFLFLGPTGVGKTETTKALAEIYFGSEKKMIRLDMSEFQAINDIPRLIGAANEEGLLTTKVREDPFSLVLLDEFEKGHPNILNLFLQVFDEGHLTDGLGRKVSFLDTIIIATSNAGYKIILEALKTKIPWSEVKQKLLDYFFAQGIFRPELINRFDGVIIFKPLDKQNLLGISELLLQKLKKNLKEKEIEFIIMPELKEKIVELGYDPVFGARQMRRVIQDKIENVLAEAILADQIKKGERVTVEPKKFKLVINP